jgi:4-amino-4-deoxy-L-arabinose transferase-like glycosyltransferase
MFRSKTRIIILIFIASFALRLLAVLALRDIHAGPTTTFADGIEFNELGYQVALGHGYELEPGHPTSFRAPGFPFFLAGVYFLAGQNYPLIYAVFCALGGAACVLTYLVASELVGSELAFLAAALAATYVNGIYFATVFASESVFLVCLGLSLWLFLRYLKNSSSLELILSALAMGWGILTRPFALLLVPLFGFILLWNRWERKRFCFGFGQAVLFGLVSLAVIAPWTIRNYRVFRQFVLVADNGGSTFYGANNDRVLREPYDYGSWVSTTELPFRNLIDATPDEVSRDHEEWHLGLQWVKRHERSMPLLSLYKLVRLWLPDIASTNRKYVKLQLLFATPFLVLILIGLFRCMAQRRYRTQEWFLLHGVIGVTVVTALIFWGSPRFRDATLPALMVYAALGMQLLLPRSMTLSNTKMRSEDAGHPSMKPGL